MTVPDRDPAPTPAIFIVHALNHAVAAATAAAAAKRHVILRSARGAAGYAGAEWFLGIIAQTRSQIPDANLSASLDCGDDLAIAIEAVRVCANHPATAIRFDGPPESHRKITDIADGLGVEIDAAQGPAVDLMGTSDPGRVARKILTD